MNKVEPIIGADAGVADPHDPCSCLNDFYRAFNRQDLVLMAANWLQTAEASMSNPLGDVHRGWSAIAAVYERIFYGSARVYVEFHDYSLHVGAEMFCAVGRERGHVELGGERIDLAIRTSRVYRRDSRGWRQLHHHGSIDDAALLARYQELVKRK
ncbi:MAG: YybH family protein [Gammaproteobacteria bacterium]